jgi:hypothetical protein
VSSAWRPSRGAFDLMVGDNSLDLKTTVLHIGR